ncbi:MAG: bifunctional riboflavin kinase/FAD synthetase, partial [bacterium]|nr:bifunctional riboflavin kinase/FAD synthetase [bacterium]
RQFPYPVVTLGNYDGVHLGHQKIFHQVMERARRHSGTAIIFTFDPHPLMVLSPSSCPPLLNTYRRKMELFESYGIDVVITAKFTRAFAATPPQDFVKDILADGIGVKEIVVGYDYAFGRGKQGTTDALKEHGRTHGFQVTVVPAYTQGDEVISTTRIRELVREGEVEKVARMLGRTYATEGIVVPGDHRGKSLGFPTANIDPHNQIFPKRGVYVVQVERGGTLLDGVLNIGTNPTFGGKRMALEVHICDFDADIYGEFVRVLYKKRLRDEVAFKSKEELIAQITKDVDQAKRILGR